MAAGDIIVISENADGQRGNYFDGTDDYVLHDAHAVARVAGNDTLGTYTAWIWADDIETLQTILSAGDNNAADEVMQFTITAAGKLQIALKHGGANQFIVTQTTASMSSKTWYHVAAVQNGTQPALYINGVNVAVTNDTATDLTFWYDELTLTDKFAIGVKESNNTHTQDFTGAIGRVRYWSEALTATEIMNDYLGKAVTAISATTERQAILTAALHFNVTMADDGITDSGLGADSGTLTGNAHYGGMISDHSWFVEKNSTGHAAEFINTFIDGSKYISIIKRGD